MKKQYLFWLMLLSLIASASASNLSILNTSATDYSCQTNLTPTTGFYNLTTIAQLNGVTVSELIRQPIYVEGGSFLFLYGFQSLSCNDTLTCYVNLSYGNGSEIYRTQISGKYSSCNITTPTVTTITPSPGFTFTTITQPVQPLNNLSGKDIPAANTSGAPSKVLGLGFTNFLKIISALLITFIIIGIGYFSPQVAVIMAVGAMDILISGFQWITIPTSLYIIINVFGVLFFIVGGKK
jgi:hypothetical protein